MRGNARLAALPVPPPDGSIHVQNAAAQASAPILLPPAAPETADPEVVWRRFKEGCSVRVLHPQRFSDTLWRLAARLESFLQCPVGCNTYLTPAGTQGFAPHW